MPAVGQPPMSNPVNLELQINTKGRLVDEMEFGNIIVKTGPNVPEMPPAAVMIV